MAGRHFASGESTPDGVVMAGSYESLDAMDGSAHYLMGAISEGIEKLDQRWIVSDLPAGQFELTFVAEVDSPLDAERITVAYRSIGEDAWRDVLRLRPGLPLTAYINRVDVLVEGDLEFRALLTPDAPALLMIDEDGEVSFEQYEPPVPGEEEGGPGLEEFVPLRALQVDYLRLIERTPN